jgi:hypothetical protein
MQHNQKRHNQMKTYFLITSLLVLSAYSCNESNPSSHKNEIEPSSEKEDFGEPFCIYSPSNKKISATFPFNEAAEIEIVSYPMRDAYSRKGENKSELIRDSVFTVEGIEDRIKLSPAQIDTLFNILYNYKAKRYGNARSAADCYNPRHSIIFYKNNKAFAFLEVCLECQGTRQTNGTDFGDFCDTKMCILQKFFRKIGVQNEISDDMCP